mmetsp:Transcript_19862/g.24504  ORF Transcript_19862/g.24504 Transcript_19862/m.24504 type:complete len:242 (-) Transcript_19862:173-898(-)
MAATPRNVNELEGSLLDPNNTTATLMAEATPFSQEGGCDEEDDIFVNNDARVVAVIPVAVPASSPVNASAVTSAVSPTDYFEYNNENMERDARHNMNIRTNIPVAPALNAFDDNTPYDQENEVSTKVRIGSDIGKILASEEKDRIKRIGANAKSKPYFDKQRVAAGCVVAKQRDREGFDVKDDKYVNEAQLLENEKKKESVTLSKANHYASGGEYKVSKYEVKEFKVTEYDESYEYKSVYD